MLLSTVLSIILVVGYSVANPIHGNPDLSICSFNQRTYDVESTGVTLRYASTMNFQFLRLDHEVFSISNNNCSSLDEKTIINCSVQQWDQYNSVSLLIENVAKYREISLQGMHGQAFDTVSFHRLPTLPSDLGYFMYNATTVFDVCPSTDKVELTWRIRRALDDDVLVQCWHNERKVCSTITYYPYERACDIKEFDDYFDVKIVAEQSVKPVDNYYCTINGGQAFSKTVYWQGPFHYRQLGSHAHFQDSEYVIISLEEERDEHLADIQNHQNEIGEQVYINHALDSLKKNEYEDIISMSGTQHGEHCRWEKTVGLQALESPLLTGYCERLYFTHGIHEDPIYEGYFNASADDSTAQRFMYHQMDGSLSATEVVLYWIVDTRQENINTMTCSTNKGNWTYPGTQTNEGDIYFKFVGPMAIYVLRAKNVGTETSAYSCTLNDKFVMNKRIFWLSDSDDIIV